ncbi:MAG: aspartate--tRNA ligase [Coriobacteriia bacterium]|nr:aspartate--tRNA ligase [Coriobacteriia bacterium]
MPVDTKKFSSVIANEYTNLNCLHSTGCGQLGQADIGTIVELTGWVNNRRDHGGLIFVDLRDRTGICQIVFDPSSLDEAGFQLAERMRPEWVIYTKGLVRARPEGTVNENMPTGEIEVLISQTEILNTAKTPPFPIMDGIETDELTRMRWRYLDIRRPEVLQSMLLRSQVTTSLHRLMTERGFIHIETPILGRSTPEGSRDYIVPSRISQGEFYALPQSPQLYKQLLMIGGLERYYQIARCFRDEDLRADRQPEFTQLDVEMSFVSDDDIMNTIEEVMHNMMTEVGCPFERPLARMTYAESMSRFGIDRPDIRFGLELVDISTIVEKCEFQVFASAVQNGGVVKAINAKGAGELSRGEIDKVAQVASDHGAQGMAWIAFTLAGEVKSPIVKYFSEDELAMIKAATAVEDGDLLVFCADEFETVCAALSAVRLYLADLLEIPREGNALLWIVDFPMFSRDKETGRLEPNHHPFSRIKDEDLDKLESDPLACICYSYDMVMNGIELGGGTLRNHTYDMQMAVFKAMGYSEAEAHEHFGFLLDALTYGTPPHGGVAFGLDRIIMMIGGYASLRDVIAFPKTSSGSDPMSGAPSAIEAEQLRDVGIRLV